jgi:pseudaminic acid cytidylyltransferase
LAEAGNIAIITARGGSKRIPRKNIRLFRGKPVMVYAIEAAIKSGLFSNIIVSTDDEEIASVARIHGAEIPFMRSVATSGDHAGTADVLLEVIPALTNAGYRFSKVCCIYPTAPFITGTILREGLQLLEDGNFDSVFPVCAFSYPVQRALQMNSDKKIEMIWPENLEKRSQDLPATYHDAGQFYWIRVDEFLRSKKIFSSNSGALALEELQVQDIDTETDWKLAELKHELLFPL